MILGLTSPGRVPLRLLGRTNSTSEYSGLRRAVNMDNLNWATGRTRPEGFPNCSKGLLEQADAVLATEGTEELVQQ